MHHKGPCCRLYTPLIYVSFKHGAIFTQQLTHLFHTHKHTNLATQRDKDKHTHTHTEGGKRASNCFLFEARHHYTTMHHRQEVRMVGVFKTHENRQIVVHTSSIQPVGGGKGGGLFSFCFFFFFNHELRVKGLNCVNGWGSFSQVTTPATQPIVCLSSKWGRTRTKGDNCYMLSKNIKVSSKDRLCFKKSGHSPRDGGDDR